MHAPRDAGSYRAEIRATVGLVAWTLAWAASLALARFGPELWGDSQPAATWAAVIANLVVGFGYVVADAAGLIPVEVEIAVLPALMGVVFLIAFVIGKIRYR